MATLARISLRGVGSASGLCKLGFLSAFHSRTITSKALREPTNKPPPYDWRNKKLGFFRKYLDRTSDRIDENSRIIAVEGLPCIGKTKFAKELAQELDFEYIPDGNMDMYYINDYGYDMRQLDPQLPPDARSMDENKFIQDPFNRNTAAFQIWKFRLRFSLFIDALAHLFSTGQGVVIERTPWSDFVFMEAMVKHKYMSREARNVYNQLRHETLHHLLRPHLVIYLDVPVEKVVENIKNRGGSGLGKALTKSYLKDIEDTYKTQFIPAISRRSELLFYDWQNGGDPELIVEDIERIDFEMHIHRNGKMKEWNILTEKDYINLRQLYSDFKKPLMHKFHIPLTEAKELWISGEDLEVLTKVYESAPGMEYATGFNPVQGESMMDWLFKTKPPKYVRY